MAKVLYGIIVFLAAFIYIIAPFINWKKKTILVNVKSILIGISFSIAIYSIFYKLDSYPIYIWDEAIYADNALEMAKSGNPIVLQLDGQVNTYNSKPPFVIWMQALFVKVVGPNELAIRLPSALAALGTCILLLLFSIRTLKNAVIGCIAILILVTTPGCIRAHVTRTGDLDSVLVFWITAYTLVALDYFIRKPLHYRLHFSVITFCVIMAFYTKAIAGLIPLAGLWIASLSSGSFKDIVKTRYVYYCILVTLACCVGFYVAREFISHGYMDVTLQSEYLRFFKNIMPWHEHPFYYYFANFYSRDFLVPYVFIFPIMTFIAIKEKGTRTVAILLLEFFLIYMIIISIPAVKLEWYDAPMYPIISLLTGIGIYHVLAWAWAQKDGYALMGALASIIFLVFFTWGFAKTNHSIRNNNSLVLAPLEREGNFMRDLHHKKPGIKKYDVLMQVAHPAHLTEAKFYAEAFTMADQADIKVVSNLDSIRIGRPYLFCQDTVRKLIQNKFEYSIIDTNAIGCRLVDINALKSK